METLNILYVGNTENSTILPALGEQVMSPQSVQEALAMYVLYFPEIIVFEGNSELVRDVFYHLSSGITAASPIGVEAMLVIADGEQWQAPSNTLIYQLASDASAAAIEAAVADLSQKRETALARAHHLQRELAGLNLSF